MVANFLKISESVKFWKASQAILFSRVNYSRFPNEEIYRGFVFSTIKWTMTKLMPNSTDF